VNAAAARAFLAGTGRAGPWSDDEAVEQAIAELIRSNSLQTMQALRARIEAGGCHVEGHVAAAGF
jgi:hypothetical protein